MRAQVIATSLLISIAACLRSAPTLQVQTEPSTAKIYKVTQAGDTLVGTGAGLVPLSDQGSTRVQVRAEGYAAADTLFPKTLAGRGPVRIRLTRRLVHLTMVPYDAQMYVDDPPRRVSAPNGTYDLVLDSGAVRTVGVALPGYKTVWRTYTNRPGAAAPPLSETLQLSDRSIHVTARPSEAVIEAGGKVMNKGDAEIAIPNGGCTNVRVQLKGYVTRDTTYCALAGDQSLQTRYDITLEDRQVKVTAVPPTAAILVDGRPVGTGEYTVVVRKKACVEVDVTAPAFLPITRAYCNEDNSGTPIPEAGEDVVRLRNDGAWPMTVESDQANINFMISVNPTRKPDDAWRILSQIITSQFDVLEITDKETGYIRTGWNVRTFDGSVIRTRAIVKLAGTTPLQYTLKLVSEEAVQRENEKKINIQDDQEFKPIPRVLLQYKDLINEAQSRLR